MSVNTAELSIDRRPVPCASDEKIVYEQADVRILVESGSGYPGSSTHYECGSGQLYLSDRRLVYVPTQRQSLFASFVLGFGSLKGIDSSPSRSWMLGTASETVRVKFVPVLDQGIMGKIALATLDFKGIPCSTFYKTLRDYYHIYTRSSAGLPEPLPLYQSEIACLRDQSPPPSYNEYTS